MNQISINVPAMGESVIQVIVAKFLKPEGAQVQEGDEVLELETDKVNQVITSPGAGIIHWSVREGQQVNIGDELAVLHDNDKVSVQISASTSQVIAAVESTQVKSVKKEKSAVTKSKSRPPKKTSSTAPPSQLSKNATDQPEVMTGIDFNITPHEMVEKIPNQSQVFLDQAQTNTGGATHVRSKLSSIRRRIAQNLLEVSQQTAMLTTFNEVDMSAVIDYRERYKEIFLEKYGVKPGFVSFFLQASTQALQKWPAIQARIEADEWLQPLNYDISVAVSTERGLLAPVIRQCDQKSVVELEQAVADVASRARSGKISLDELRGGNFTITNGGVFGSLLSTPILNPPQSAILGLHRIQKRVVVGDGDQIVIRPMMYVALSYDHRVIDGKEAVTFLVEIKELIENPERLCIEAIN